MSFSCKYFLRLPKLPRQNVQSLMTIDLRSDTLTQPTPEMREAMYQAVVGDDVYGEDPTINTLQERAAAMFGMDKALFCPSGTMCNQIAIRLHTQPQDQVICDQYSHIYLYEGGGVAANALASIRLLKGNRGKLTVEMIDANINVADPHFPVSSLVSLENSHNKGGGSVYPLAEIEKISALCQSKGLRMHLDGARLFNALVAAGELDRAQEYGRHFDSISFCLSKGLGAPVGSLLLCREADYFKALRVRKMMGGGMRQAGIIAAAGLYALEHHVERLVEDHRRAQVIGEQLRSLNWMGDVMPIETNIIGFAPESGSISMEAILEHLKGDGILAAPFGGGYVRFVTHLDIDDEMLDRLFDSLKRIAH